MRSERSPRGTVYTRRSFPSWFVGLQVHTLKESVGQTDHQQPEIDRACAEEETCLLLHMNTSCFG